MRFVFRFRLSSVQLVGDLLYHISGVSGKMSATGEEDENYGTAEGFKVICVYCYIYSRVRRFLLVVLSLNRNAL